jgi:hypothetical protein
MSSDVAPDVSALAINVTIPEGLRWTDTRRGEEFTPTSSPVIQPRTSTSMPWAGLPGYCGRCSWLGRAAKPKP